MTQLVHMWNKALDDGLEVYALFLDFTGILLSRTSLETVA